MAIPGTTQVVSDNFNRANENPISTNGWTDSGAADKLQLLTNTVQPTSFVSGVDAYAIRNNWTSGDDQYSQAEVTVVGTGANSGFGVVVRHSPTAATVTFYRLVMASNGGWELCRFVAGAKTSILTGTATYAAGTALGLLIQGATLSCWYGGVQIGTNKIDANILIGVPGLAYSTESTSGSLDNWDAGIPSGGFRKNALKPYPFKPSGLNAMQR